MPIECLLKPEHCPPAQIGRLSVLKGPRATDAVFGMAKAAWLWCLQQGIGAMVIASPPWAFHIYKFMHYEDLGEEGWFHHPFARGALHVTMVLPVATAERRWRELGNPLCAQMFDIEHPRLIFDT